MATVGQRIRAAQVQAGIQSVDELAGLPGRPARFGAKTIGRVIRGERDLEQHEAEWLASALRVDAGYFYEDRPAETQLDRIERRLSQLDAVEARLAAMHAMLVEGQDVIDRLDLLQESLEAAITESAAAETEEWQRIAQDLVEGHPGVPQDSRSEPQRTSPARTKRAAAKRTP